MFTLLFSIQLSHDTISPSHFDLITLKLLMIPLTHFVGGGALIFFYFQVGVCSPDFQKCGACELSDHCLCKMGLVN